MELNLKGKTALITAASSGIGKATAEMLIQEGVNVAICSRNKLKLEMAVHEMKNLYNIEPYYDVCDINKPSEIESTVNNVIKKFDKIDILINNCGGPVPGIFEELNDDNWEDALEQVLMSAIRFTRLVLPKMKSNKWGRIINITSLSVKQPVDNLILSNSLRSAVTAFAKTMSNHLGKFNITVNNVAPGYTLTPRINELAEKKALLANTSTDIMLALMADEVPMKRMAKSQEVASIIAFLASEQAGYITGQTIAVDGGLIKATY